MTSRLPGHPALFLVYILFLATRVASMLAHFSLLIYELVHTSWDDAASSIMVVTLIAVTACLGILLVRPNDKRSNLSKTRFNFLMSLSQSVVMTALLIAYSQFHPRNALLIVHSINLAHILVILASNSKDYHKLRLAPPDSSLHMPFDALIAGNMDAIRAARPDYSRKALDARKKKSQKKSPVSGKEDALGDTESAGDVPKPQAHSLGLTAEGDINVGSKGEDERKWWEKW